MIPASETELPRNDRLPHKALHLTPLSANVVHARHDADVASCMPDMTPTSLVVAVMPCTGKIVKKGFLKEEKICYKMVCYT